MLLRILAVREEHEAELSEDSEREHCVGPSDLRSPLQNHL